MKQHNVDFIGGRLQHECLNPQLVTCSRIQSFQHLVIRFCGDFVRWKSSTVSALGCSLCLSAHMSGVWIHMAATSLTMQRLASEIVINPLTSLRSYISVPPTCLVPPASCAANMHNKEGNAGITNLTVREEDVHDCDLVRQGHVSAFLFTPSAVARESFASQLCLPTALMHGRFASYLCLCLCLVSPPQLPDIATLYSPSSASHAGDGHGHTTVPRVFPQPPPGLERYAHLCTTPMRILQLSSPSGTPAPRSTGCTTILPPPKSVPTAGWIRVVLCQRVDFQLPLTLYSGQFWRSFAHITTQALFSLPTWTNWYQWIKPQCLLQTIAVITAATRSVNLALQTTKTQIWKGSCQDPNSTGVPRQGHAHTQLFGWTSTNPRRY